MSGCDFIVVVVVGYEVGICVGEFFGCLYYKVFYMIGIVGMVVVVVMVGWLFGLLLEWMFDVFGLVGM